MLYYIGVLLICFFFTVLKNSNSEKVTSMYLFLLGVFLCFGYTTGTDWRTYEQMYGWVREDGLGMLLFMEPGYVIYTYIFSNLGVDFFHFFIFTKIILYFIVVRTLRFYCPKDIFYISFLFFLAWYAFFMFIDNPMRNLIAIAIFFSSLKYLRERHFIPYLLLTFFAMSFHFSAIIMLLLYYFGNKSYKTTNIVIAYLIVNLLLLNNKLIFFMLESLFSAIPIVGSKIATYSSGNEDGEGKLLSLGLVVHTILFILIIIGRGKIEIRPYGKMIFMFSVLFSMFFRLGLTITVMGRFQLYIAVFYVASIGMSYYVFEARTRIVYLFFVLLISIGPCVSYLIKDSRYIPYTNYLFFLDTDMSFDERSNYNPNNSPYKSPRE